MRNIWLPCDVVSEYPEEQKKSLGKLFGDADKKKTSRAIHAVFLGARMYKAHKENPPDPLQAARQITRMKNALESLTTELSSLSVDSMEAFHRVGVDRAEHEDMGFWKFASDLQIPKGHRPYYEFQALCTLALRKLPKVDSKGKKSRGRPKGTIVYHDRVLASNIIEAFCIMNDRYPKLLGNDKTEVDPIYKCIDMFPNHGILRQMIENIIDIKSEE